MHSEKLFSHRLYPPLPRAAGGTGVKGAAYCDRNPPTDIVPTAALPTNGLHIPARVGGLDATADDVDDEVQERGYSRLKSSEALEPGGEKAGSSDGTIRRNPEKLIGSVGPQGSSWSSGPWSNQCRVYRSA